MWLINLFDWKKRYAWLETNDSINALFDRVYVHTIMYMIVTLKIYQIFSKSKVIVKKIKVIHICQRPKHVIHVYTLYLIIWAEGPGMMHQECKSFRM